MALTEQFIRDTYSKLKNKAEAYISKGNLHKGLLYIHLAAYTNYSFWLSYYDDEIERLLVKASMSIKPKTNIAVIPGRCVMLDSLSRYRGGLTVQYVRAIIAAGWDLLYITEQEMKAPNHVELYNYLSQFKQITIIEIPKKYSGVDKLQFIYDEIIKFRAERVYLHSSSSDSLFPTICYGLPAQIQKFYIDIADHGFRMGMTSCETIFQFRSLGCSIAERYRGIAPEHILYLPFYPVMDTINFKGYPKDCEGKKIIFSGGIFWKICDKDDTFFRLSKQLLEQNPQAIIVYAGGGDSKIVKNKITEYGLKDRFILLGWRDDICELFRACDIFLNTYPHGGGTMSLYAAHLNKPILSFIPDDNFPNPIEMFLCQKKYYKVSSVGKDEFLLEANKLLNSEDYRLRKITGTFDCVISPEDFNSMFKEMSISHKSIIAYSKNQIIGDISRHTQEKIAFHNEQGEYQMRLVALAGLNSITMKADLLKPFLLKIIPKIKRVISKNGFHFNRI